MFELEKQFYFEAGHLLTHHQGTCRRPHGHSYRFALKIRGHSLNSSGSNSQMVMDFQQLSAMVRPMIDQYFDHQWLNETLNTDSPTAEFIAEWIYHYLKRSLPALYSVTVWETSTASATYWE